MKLKNVLNPFYAYEHRAWIKPTLKAMAKQVVRPLFVWPAERGRPLTENDRKLAALKDKHRGERCFIIGNGPSLRISDLDMLKSDITFASNKIYLAFDQTEWRPTYYSVMDVLVAENNHSIISELKVKKIFSDSVRPFLKGENDAIWLTELLTSLLKGSHEFGFSTNIVKGVYGGCTVIYHQIQLAFYMGIREIYLIGVDFRFNVAAPTGGVSVLGEVVLENRGETNHFHPDYRKPGEKWTMPQLELQREAFLTAKKALENHGGCILNASRESALDVFPRVDFDTLAFG